MYEPRILANDSDLPQTSCLTLPENKKQPKKNCDAKAGSVVEIERESERVPSMMYVDDEKKSKLGFVYTGIEINLLFCLRRPDLDFDVF